MVRLERTETDRGRTKDANDGDRAVGTSRGTVFERQRSLPAGDNGRRSEEGHYPTEVNTRDIDVL